MKENARNRAVVAEVIARAWREPAYLSQLRQNPKRVLETAGANIPSKMDVMLLENTSTLINVILPPTAQTANYEARMQAAAQLLKDLPEDMEVHLHRDSDARAFIVLPEPPGHGGELSDKQLEAAVGGKGSSSHKTPPPPPPSGFLGGPAPQQIVIVGVNPVMTTMSGGGEVVAVITGTGEPSAVLTCAAVVYV